MRPAFLGIDRTDDSTLKVVDPSRDSWLLGYDGDCGICQALAADIVGIAGDRIGVVSLRSRDAAEWFRDHFGPEAELKPTLFRVRGEVVDAWAGPAMMVRLTTVIGPRRAWMLAERLGDGQVSRLPDSTDAVTRRSLIAGAAGIAAALAITTMPGSGSAASPGQCGVTAQYLQRSFLTRTGDTNCRRCPNLNSPIDAVVSGNTPLNFQAKTSKPAIGNYPWWWSSGPAQCWIREDRLIT